MMTVKDIIGKLSTDSKADGNYWLTASEFRAGIPNLRTMKTVVHTRSAINPYFMQQRVSCTDIVYWNSADDQIDDRHTKIPPRDTTEGLTALRYCRHNHYRDHHFLLLCKPYGSTSSLTNRVDTLPQ